MPRIFWGLLLIAIGVGALLDIELWPLVLIVVGVALLLPVLTGRRRHRNWHQMWWCWWDPSTGGRSMSGLARRSGRVDRPVVSCFTARP